jgi:hypothetical protein
MAEGGRIIATVVDYSGFVSAIRSWIAQVGVSYETVEHVSGIQPGYLTKLICSTPTRSFSRVSLGATLGALCLRLQLVVDEERLAQMQPRFTARKKQPHADDGMPRKKIHYLRGNSTYMSALRHKGVLILSPRRRRALARHAAAVRWKNARKSGGQPPP